MSLEDAIEKNTQAINKLTDAVSASLEGQNVALKALTSIVEEKQKPVAAPVVEKPKKVEPVKQAEPEPEPEEDDLLVADDEIVEPAITYETIVKRFREIAVERGGKEFAVKLLGKYGIKRLEATALPAEKFPAFWEEMSKFKINNGANNG